MTARLTTAALACALSAAIPGRAAAQSYNGQLGLRYDRVQTWDPGGGYGLVPTLQLDGYVNAEGYAYARDFLHWNGSLSYLNFRNGEGAAQDKSNSLGYTLSLELFRSPTSRLPVTASASRVNVDHAFTASTGDRATGTTTSTYYGLGTAVALPGRPILRAGASRLEETNSGAGRPTSNQTTDNLTVGLRHGPGPYDIDASYDGRFRRSNLAFSNFDEHNVRFQGTAMVSPQIAAYASDFYQQRTATTVDEFNPTSENNSFSGGVRGADPNNAYRWFVHYDYGHFFIEAPGLERTEQFTHSVTAQSERQFTPAWRGTLFAAGNATQFRLGGADQITAGQSLGALATWTGPVSPTSMLLLEAGPTLGAIEPRKEQPRFAYGGTARTRWTVARSWRSSLEYQVAYGTNLEAIRGWSLNQRLQGDVSASLGRRLRLSGYVSATGSRLHDDLLGDSVAQTAQAEGRLDWLRYALQLGFVYAAAPTVFSSGTASDGLFIPAKFSSTSRFGYATATASLTARLTVQGGARYGSASGAGLPNQREYGLSGTVTYSLGLLALSVEDRYVAGGAEAFDTRTNVLFVRLSRVFGGRY